MYEFLITLHATAAAIVVGALFVQSMAVVMAQRLNGDAQREGVRMLERRMHLFIYYPILAVTLLTGLILAITGGAFADGRWLHWKLLFVIVLVGLGFLTGRNVTAEQPLRAFAMAVHVLIFIVSGCILYLAVLQPY